MNANPTPTAPTTLTSIIHTLVAALLPYVAIIRTDFEIARQKRTQAAARLTHILQQLLALTARLNPAKVGEHHIAPRRPTPLESTEAPAQALPARPNPVQGRRPRPYTKAPQPLSARQTAERLRTLLQELQEIANELCHPLSAEILALCKQASAAAGCQALEPEPKNYDIVTEYPGHNPPPRRYLLL